MAAESSKSSSPVDLPQDSPVASSGGLPRGQCKSLPSILIPTGGEKGPALMYVLPQGQKAYQCGFCDVCFDAVRDLYSHVNVHLSTNPYKCGYCKTSYKTNFSLTVHVKTHRMFLCLSQGDLQNGQCGNSAAPMNLDLQSLRSISSIPTGIERRDDASPDQKGSLGGKAGRQTPQREKYVVLVDEGELHPSKSKVLGRSANTGELTLEDRPRTASARSQSPGNEQTVCVEPKAEPPTRERGVANFPDVTVDYGNNDSDNDDHDGDDFEEDEHPPDSQGSLSSLKAESAPLPSTSRMLVHIDSLLARNSEITQKADDLNHTFFQKQEESEEDASNLDGGDAHRQLRSHSRGRKNQNRRKEAQNPKSKLDTRNVQRKQSAAKKKKTKTKKPLPHQEEDIKPSQQSTHEQYGALKPFACSLCGDKFADPKLVSEHFRGVHKVGKDQILLPDSSKGQSDGEQETAVHGEKDNSSAAGASKSDCFSCPVCERPFKFCQDLMQHIELGHENDLRPFQCGMCCRRFKQTAHLRDHFDAFHGSGLTRAKRLKLSRSGSSAVQDLNLDASLPIHFAPDGALFGQKDSCDVVCKKETVDAPDMAAGIGENSLLGDLARRGSDQIPAQNPSSFITDHDPEATYPDDCSVWPTDAGEDKSQLGPCLQQHTAPEPSTSPARPFLCSFCKEEFEDVKLIRIHVQSVHKFDKNHAAAANPDQSFFSDKDLGGSEGDERGQDDSQGFSKLIRCYVCEKPFRLRQELGRHVLTDHGEKEMRLFECSLCGRMFKRGHYIRIHFKLCHDDSFSSHQCPQCGKKFPVLYQLTRHEKTCSLTREPKKTSGNREGRAVKRDKDDKAQGKASSKCDNKGGKRRSDICYICGTITHQLQQHIKIHQTVGAYQCRFCSKTFRHRSVLHKHLNLHTHEKTYVCDTCGKSFATLYSWKIHRNTHTNERPYKCELCGRGFNAMSHLGVHKMRHYQDKRHQCDKCERKFYTKTNLKKHALTHTDLRPFSCKECGKTYRCWGSLKYHKDHKHPLG
ncbi:hypothetical protein ACOMHN_039045 [Nucella lapillus]